ncbi:MAG TPA: hypothetical protein VLG46_02585, partial [Anaerolineae bacterium]|nr:hypothetical protein [Anaerolineae bacterium]
MNRFFAFVSTIVLGLLLLLTVTATQAATALQPPIEQAAQPASPRIVQHTQPVTPGAPADIVLVIDNSESQAYNFAVLPEPYASKCSQVNIDDVYACLNGGTLHDGTPITGCNNETVSDPNFPGLTRGICQPFRQNKEAAYRFIQQLRPGVDRVALINFSEYSWRLFPMSYTLSGTGSALDRLNNMDVYVSPSNASQPNPGGHMLCNSSTAYGPDAWKCGSSNLGAGLIAARDEFGLAEPQRPEAQWVT